MRLRALDHFHGDEMTPKERMKAFAAGTEMDRVPCWPLISEHSSKIIGVPVSQYCHSAELMAEAVIETFKVYRPDGGLFVTPGIHGIAEAMGTKLKYPEDGAPFVSEPALKDYGDLSRLSPADPRRDGRLPLCLEALKLVNGQIGNEIEVGSVVGGPFTTASDIRGTEKFLKDLHKHPEMAHRLLCLATESILNYVNALYDCGFHPAIISEPNASGSLISPKLFREFVKPYLKKIADRCMERGGSAPMLHVCGDSSLIWEDMADTGSSVLSLDYVIDLAEAKKTVGHRVCLAGNVKPAETLMLGNPDQVYAEVRECLRKAYDNPKGYILSSGCGLPLETPPRNVVAMMEAVRIYGRLPIIPERLM